MNKLEVLEAVAMVTRREVSRRGHTNVRVRTNPRKWATYHTYDRRKLRGNLISFGGEMVKLHMECNGIDLVIKEMRNHGWGDLLGWSLATELACVILHELTHLEISVDGFRRYGSVHNRMFYTRMDKAVREQGESIALELSEIIGSGSLTERPPATVERIRKENHAIHRVLKAANPKAITHYHSRDFGKGMRVAFTHKGIRQEGVITRRGKKRWTVLVSGMKYYVPERMLERV